ncbi:2'-5' RNA ligase family protein [Sphingomonas sp.]|uniref:2'-5' RNA ligase family protein n=1 Tax=Sphingomonas sp. TaxID=28214 RepID=UPI0025E223D1|nr:2'-5' RNA ligase family protein [Sphingomonas sp.]
MRAPLIVTAELGAADLAWFDGLRRRHFPPERNQLSAHLTMLHAVPAMLEAELKHRLAILAADRPRPRSAIAGLLDLGGGTAYRVVSDDLDAIRAELTEAFRGSLTAQDTHGWRPHVTIQNKVAPRIARALQDHLERDFVPRPLAITGLACHRYEGGPWRAAGVYPFRGR